MGLPWDDLADAIGRLHEAERGRGPEAVDAAAEVERQRERLALVGALLFDAATRPVPGGPPPLPAGSVTRLLDLAGVPDLLAELQARIDEPRRHAEWMAAEVRRLKAENWELARTIARLELRVEELEEARRGEIHDGQRPGGRSGREAVV